jgi:predicted lipoprotein with Yx(FWY)xxD motif
MALLLVACSTSSGSSASAQPSSAAASASASAATAGGATVLVADSDLGQILTDADGNVIYYFANDEEGVSNCEGDCLSNWPPVAVDGSPTAGDGVSAQLGTVDGNDGSTQLTVNGYPAYYFAGDQAAGDTNGQGVGGIWWVFGADGEPIEG